MMRSAHMLSLAIASCLVAHSAQSQESFSATDPIVLATEEMPGVLESGDVVRFDGMVVTDWSRVSEDGRLRIELPVELAPGPHRVRWERGAAGAARTLAEWSIEIEEPARVQVQWGGSVTLEASHRSADRRLPPNPPDRFQLRGSAELRGALRSGGDTPWQAQLRAPLLYDRVNGIPPDGRSLELGDFLVDGSRGPLSFRLGHFTPVRSSLILEGFPRRGLSTSLDLPQFRSRFTAFTVRAEPITGFREGLGIQDHDHRVSGASGSVGLLELDGGTRLRLDATYLGGRGSASGASLASAFRDDVRRGNAWSTALTLDTWDGRIQLRGEYARTRSELRDGSGRKARRDDARSLFARITPLRDVSWLDEPVTTNLSFEWREVGPEFESLANVLAPIDRKLSSAAWRGRWWVFDGRVAFSRERDNVDARAELPRFRTDLLDTDLGIQLRSPTSDDSLWRRGLGAGFVRVRWSRERLNPVAQADLGALSPQLLFPVAVFVPAGGGVPILIAIGGGAINSSIAPFALAPLDDRLTRIGSVRVGSRYARWSFSGSQTVIRRDDLTRIGPDTRSRSSSLDVGYTPKPRWNLRGSLQRQRETFGDVFLGRTTWQGRLGGSWRNEAGRFGMTADVTWSRTRDAAVTDLQTIGVNAGIDWRVFEPDGLKPGLVLGLSAQFQDFQDDINRTFNAEVYQVFMTASLTWARAL